MARMRPCLLKFFFLKALSFSIRLPATMSCMHSPLYLQPFVAAFYIVISTALLYFTAFCTFVLLTITPSLVHALLPVYYHTAIYTATFLFYIFSLTTPQTAKAQSFQKKKSVDTASFELFLYIIVLNLIEFVFHTLFYSCLRKSRFQFIHLHDVLLSFSVHSKRKGQGKLEATEPRFNLPSSFALATLNVTKIPSCDWFIQVCTLYYILLRELA